MAIDYEQIRKDNIEEYGKGVRHLAFFERLYSDGTHFILELLQNAEDAKATQIEFLSFPNRLEVRHNGRPFNENDVRGVCGVGESTKEHDFTQIGRFGIGFKSVYAFTNTPTIHCGDEHFEIRHYVRPYAVSAQPLTTPWTTLIIIPFDKNDVSEGYAATEIATRLRCLSVRTLLFLASIDEINYVVVDADSGTYLKSTRPCINSRLVTVVGEKSGVPETESEQWLVFDKPLLNDNGVIGPNGHPVPPAQIAFLLEDRETEPKKAKQTSPRQKKVAGSQNHWDTKKVVALSSSPLVVFFPTEKESQLGFLIQGPYRTTPARDNIPSNDEWNVQLIAETATLLTSTALPALKEMGLLTVGVFGALPINMDNFPENGFFFPIADAVRSALQTEELLPAVDGSFTSARNALLGRGQELRSLLGNDQLKILFDIPHEVKWLSGDITPDNAPVLRDYLRDELTVAEVTPESIALRITTAFMERQSDEWVTAFYGTLLSWEALWKPRRDTLNRASLRDREFLRLEDGSHVKPFDAMGQPNAYLPLKVPTQLPVVRASVANDKSAKEFLTRLGLSEPDVVAEVIEELLPRYLASDVFPSAGEHAEHMKEILAAWSTDSIEKRTRLQRKLRETPFVRYHCRSTGDHGYARPTEVYFPDDDLLRYFDGHKNAKFMVTSYGKESRDLLRELGTRDVPRCFEVSYGDPPYKHRSTGVDTIRNYVLDGLDEFLGRLGAEGNSDVRRDLALDLWRYLLAYVDSGHNIFEARRHYYYYSNRYQPYDSLLAQKLHDTAWLPKPDGSPGKPSDISIDQLPDDFEQNEKLILALRIQPDPSQQLEQERQTKRNLATQLGINLEDADFISQHRDEFEQFMKAMRDRSARWQAVGEPSSRNRERRRIKLLERRDQAPTKRSVRKLRAVPGYSRNEIDRQSLFDFYFDVEEEVSFCQMCLDPMPFVKRNGEEGGECVDLFTQAWAGTSGVELKVLTSLKLVLCPVCSEVYREYVHKDHEKQDALHEHLTSGVEGNFAICDTAVRRDHKDHVLHFNQTHLADIQDCLEQDDE